MTQLPLPFPPPAHADIWPNALGFNIGPIEFWAHGARDLESMTFGRGDNWVEALADLATNPKECT